MNTVPKLLYVLISEYDDDDRFLFDETLKVNRSYIEVRFARDKDELLNIIDELYDPPPPNLILLDKHMPCKTGVECLEVIHSIKQYDNVPVFMVSTSNSIKDIKYSYTYTYSMGSSISTSSRPLISIK